MTNSKNATPEKRTREDLIQLIIDLEKDKELARRFLKCKTKEDIQKWFKKEGYGEVLINDCEDLVAPKIGMRGRGVDKNDNPVDTDTEFAY